MPKKTIKAFTLLELLVVIAILGVFTVIAFPNVTKWITDREVKKEVYDFVAEINEMKFKVSNGEYALAMVFFDTSNFKYANMKKYYMSTEDYISNYSGGNSNFAYCYNSPNNQKYHSVGTFNSELVRHWPRPHICISKNGTKKAQDELDLKNPDTGQSKSLGRVIFCSINNTTEGNGSNRCNDNNKNDFRYMVTWDIFANLTVYKFNFKKNQWCTSKTCRSYSEFN